MSADTVERTKTSAAGPSHMRRPNILYIVIDSLRLDAIPETSTLRSLADDNLFFKQAITPATWSLPAYTSLLTGTYPHEHGVTQPGDIPDSLRLVEELSERGYSTYGISGNPFLSPSQGFDEPFDRFWLTPRLWYPAGLDVSRHETALKKVLSGYPKERIVNAAKFTQAFLRHPNRLQSLVNFGFVLGHRLNLGERVDRTISHPLFDKPAYRPEMNTSIIERLIENESRRANPFFIFAQYNDPHHVNWPPADIISEIDGLAGARDIVEINERTSTLRFISDSADSEQLKKRRELYRGDVKHVDRHIKRLLAALREHGLDDETLVIVTADHGENLGETDRRGRRRMGHFASLSENLVRVPLIVAHPGLDIEPIDRWVSTKDICPAILDGSLIEPSRVDGQPLVPEDGVVLSEAPAKGGTDVILENNPNAPIEVISEETRHHNVQGRYEGWTVIKSSTGADWAWEDPEAAPLRSAPELLRSRVEHAVETLSENHRERTIPNGIKRRLEELGYA